MYKNKDLRWANTLTLPDTGVCNECSYGTDGILQSCSAASAQGRLPDLPARLCLGGSTDSDPRKGGKGNYPGAPGGVVGEAAKDPAWLSLESIV